MSEFGGPGLGATLLNGKKMHSGRSFKAEWLLSTKPLNILDATKNKIYQNSPSSGRLLRLFFGEIWF